MSFLQNAKIRTKVLSIIIPICLIGVTGVLFVSSQYKDTVATYSDFISNDETAAVEMSRASQRVTALSYNAYQVLVYSSKDPEIAKITKDYDDNKRSFSSGWQMPSVSCPLRRRRLTHSRLKPTISLH